ncbi:MAG: DUF1549 domain-containing protein, partial [Planctomycetota bacterium]|nr:DUF1549 domain-containing protein [Planctomycetota bacterium]
MRHQLVLSTLLAAGGITLNPGDVGNLPSRLLAGETTPKIDYGRDVRPILAANCYACHGPDPKQRQARLRLDQKESALRKARGRRPAIIPGKPARSLLIRRITHEDEDERMPPADSGKKLTAKDIETLRRWIAEGAEWSDHWAYILPRRPPLPQVEREEWPRTPVDRFILARLEREGLAPSPAADRVTLLRRLSFDLVGLPSAPQEVAAFLADESREAYERQVNRLLDSPHYGERMAIFWLDLVRFADTRGYHSDNPRNVSPYRDYVIRAFNDNLPFDRFTIEQLAGDLLPDAGLWQRVASCYNKLNQSTEEGGAQAKEYEAITAADRVRHVSVIWMGATLGCAQCHEHKFDPYKARDFYSMAAFFADIREKAILDKDAGIPVPTEEEAAALRVLDEGIAALKRTFDSPGPELTAELAKAQAEWERKAVEQTTPGFGPWYAIGPFFAGNAKEAFTTAYAPEKEIDLEKSYEDGKLEWRKEEGWVDGKVHTLRGGNAATYLYRTIDVEDDTSLKLSLGSDDTIQVWINGDSVLSKEVYRGVAPDQEMVTLPLRKGTNRLLLKITNGSGGYGFYFRPVDAGGAPGDIRKTLEVPVEKRTEEQRASLAAHYRSIAPQLAAIRAKLKKSEKERVAFEKRLARCLVSVPDTPRVVRILPRGNWLDESGPVVQPSPPQFVSQTQVKKGRATRLDLAKWMMA